ncbi:NUDIX hydrolase [Methylocella silvestris]|uniref:NUDIX hydrolase n=1 Tax=Methylocella silvestris TaxID=199596 RepID=A0A2J7TDX1_METSI|nr:NUDIX hydrolase [Methylocella silvestris]PNG24975.1 NUDIX hydrolase [Methylocella silvestris]
MSSQSTAEPAPESARLYPAYPFLAVSIAVFRGGAVLLATRTRAPFAGDFSLPGGLVEAGETLEAAALRELAEEVQVEARIFGFNRHVESIERDASGRIKRHFVIASFIGEWISGEGTPGPEAGRVLWAPPAALARLPCTPLTAEVVEGAAARYFRAATPR